MAVNLIFVVLMSAFMLSGQQGAPRRLSFDHSWSRAAVQRMAAKCSAEAPKPPAQAVSADDFVKLERTLSYRGGPLYTVKIHADGRVVWQRGSEGPVSNGIQPEAGRDLIERIRGSGFWSLCKSYPFLYEDGWFAITTVRIGDEEKQVSDGDVGAPDFLRDFEYEIDLMADTHHHFHGDPAMENFTRLDWDSWYAKAGVTTLMQASARGSLAEVKEQLSTKPDPNAQDASGWTALMYASLAQEPEVMQALLDARADPNLRSHRGQTAIMAVSTVFISSDEKVRMLKAAGGDINAQDADGQTALMMAADGSDPLKIVPILLREGARKDLRDAKGKTVLERLESKDGSLSAKLNALRRTVETSDRKEQISAQEAEYEKLRQLLHD